ncbi:MAG: copper homeostasis protein CutC [Symbiobacteriaceae bacterium]|nr:copper homeostasis protein CutC [Symbiobacteriaceae bacterium]
MSSILVEVCCGSLDDALKAAAGGADRIELNSAFFLGGLTPSLGTLQECRERINIPLIAMVRPRYGGMCYSEGEFATMLRDAAIFVNAGAAGVVFGFLQPDGRIDEERTAAMVAALGSREAVFHRAFDLTPDPCEALETLIRLGVKRVLTSGQKPNVFHAQDLIKQLIQQAGSRMEVLPGAGLDEYNIQEFIRNTGTTQVHIAPMGWGGDSSPLGNPAITFGGALYPSEVRYEALDSQTFKRMQEAIAVVK